MAVVAVLAGALCCGLAAAPAQAGTGGGDPTYSVTVAAKRESRGTLIAIHGGGWVGGNGRVDAIAAHLGYVADWDWNVVAVGYRSGSVGLDDVVAWFDRLRAETSGPICAWGASSGGHYALLLAVKRDLDCVIAEAPPTYLPETTERWGLSPQFHDYVVSIFGEDMLGWYSPLLWHPRIAEPILLGHAKEDGVVPLGQSRQLYRRDDRTTFFALDSGTEPFPHQRVDAGDLANFERAELRLLRSVE